MISVDVRTILFFFRLVTQGFHSGSNRTSSDSDSINYMSTVPRLVVSSPLLLELLQVVYHGLEKGASGVAQTLHDIAARATYETYAGMLFYMINS